MQEAQARQHVVAAIMSVAPETTEADLDTDDLWYELDLDSMDQLNVMTKLSEATGVEIPETAYPELTSVDELIAFVLAGAPA